MSVFHLVRCEQYKECQQEFSFDLHDRGLVGMPDQWLTIFEGSPQTNTGRHFCSKECLVNWIFDHWQIAEGFSNPTQVRAYKARRFWLVDDQEKATTEGVKWGNGTVTLEQEDGKLAPYFGSWGEFKRKHEPSGVHWLDFPSGGGE